MLQIIAHNSGDSKEAIKRGRSRRRMEQLSCANHAIRTVGAKILSLILTGFMIAVATLNMSAVPNVYAQSVSSTNILQPSLSQTPVAETAQQPATLLSPRSTVPPPTIYPQSLFPGTGSVPFFPYQTGLLTPTLPPPYTTYPPSVFPPTTSFATSTSIAPVTGPLSPWFPSVPAISCGGTFSMTVVGAMDTNNDDDDDNNGNGNNNNNKKDNGDDNGNNNNNNNDDDDNDRKLYAFQIQSDGGTALDAESIEGQVFRGENNIERNNGEDFDVKDVFNDCQVVTFSD